MSSDCKEKGFSSSGLSAVHYQTIGVTAFYLWDVSEYLSHKINRWQQMFLKGSVVEMFYHPVTFDKRIWYTVAFSLQIFNFLHQSRHRVGTDKEVNNACIPLPIDH